MHLRLAAFTVKAEAIHHFRTATLQHVHRTRQEAGVLRFELMQSAEDPGQFVLLMAFQDDSARARHMATEHFKTWRETVASWLSEPIRSIQYTRVDQGEGQGSV
jgi:quinol monooxygenase YgiN